MKSKKITKTLSALLLVAGIFAMTPGIPAHAQWGNDPTTNSDYCKTQHISTYFSQEECKNVISRANAASKWSGGSSAVIGSLGGKKAAAITGALAFYSYDMSEFKSIFEDAVSRDGGLTVSYDYKISNVSYSLNKVENFQVEFD